MCKKLSIKLAFIVFISLSISLVCASIILYFITKPLIKKSLNSSSENYIESILPLVSSSNDLLVQQLIDYKKYCNYAKVKNSKDIQNVLVKERRSRAPYFISTAYVDYSSGLGYFEDGHIANVSHYDWYKQMVKSQQKDKELRYSSGVGKDNNLELYYALCNETNIISYNGYCSGFFVGFVRLYFLQNYIKNVQLSYNLWSDSDTNKVLIMNKNLSVLYSSSDEFEDMTLINYKKWKFNNESINFISHAQNYNTLSGEFIDENSNRYSAYLGKIPNTDWTLCVLVPHNSIIHISRLAITKYSKLFFLILFIILIFLLLVFFNFTFSNIFKINIELKKFAANKIDLDFRFNKIENTEIGEIQASLNTYLDKLSICSSNVTLYKDTIVDIYMKLNDIARRFKASISTINVDVDKFKSSSDCRSSSIIEQIMASLKELSNVLQIKRELDNLLNALYMFITNNKDTLKKF